MKTIPLTQGFDALIDDGDYEAVVAAGPWHADISRHTVYAMRNIRRPDGRQTHQRLHTFLTGWAETDHRDRNGLNNQRTNLREATPSQNRANIPPAKANRSGFKGVSWCAERSRWKAQIQVNGRNRGLGRFQNREMAARAYDAAARFYFGEFAYVNFP